jgi:hypothetical protein
MHGIWRLGRLWFSGNRGGDYLRQLVEVGDRGRCCFRSARSGVAAASAGGRRRPGDGAGGGRCRSYPAPSASDAYPLALSAAINLSTPLPTAHPLPSVHPSLTPAWNPWICKAAAAGGARRRHGARRAACVPVWIEAASRGKDGLSYETRTVYVRPSGFFFGTKGFF